MRRGGLLAGLVSAAASLVAAGLVAAEPTARVTPLGLEPARLTSLTAAPNGQRVYAIDESRRAVVAIDPFAPGRVREVVAAAAAGQAEPVSILALPGDLLGVVCRTGDEWSLRTYRTRPSQPADAERPWQEFSLGSAPAGSHVPSMAVSRSRDWFVVAGLPPPLPPVVRAAVAGPSVRLRPNHSGAEGTTARPVAVAVAPGDDLVLLEAADARGGAQLVCVGPGGRELLRLDTGLVDVRGAAYARDGSALWVITGGATDGVDQPAGVWRLEAVIRAGVQAVRPTCVARLDEPQAMAAVSDRSLVVVHGTAPPGISRIDEVATGANVTKKSSEENPP